MLLFGLIWIFSSVAACPPLFPQEGVEVDCSYHGQVFDCATNESPSGALAIYKCGKFFDNDGGTLVCTENNVWDLTGLRKFCSFYCRPKCGLRASEINQEEEEQRKTEKLIVLGKDTTSSSWPWHAGIFNYQSEYNQYICGGTFTIEPITETQMIITAAHCLINDDKKSTNPGKLKVVIGSLSSDFKKNSDPAQIFDVKYFKIHEKYDTTKHTNDIAFIILNETVKIGMSALPVCYPSPQYAPYVMTGSTGVVTGYGRTENKNLSDILKYTQLFVVEPEKCSYTTAEPGFQFCAGPLEQKMKFTQQELISSPCNGDSGGGYVVKQDSRKYARYFIAGIVSTTKKREDDSEVCQSNTIFTQVDGYASWMRDWLLEQSFIVPSTKPSFVPIKLNPIKDTNDYLNVGLVLHNKYRAMHGSQPITLNSALISKAQEWAEYLIRENLWEVFPPTSEFNTNQFKLSSDGPPLNVVETVESAVETWYNSSQFYDWSEPEKNRTTFTQLVWNSTTQLGIGVSSRGKDTIVIAAYSPPGNYVGAKGKYYRDNVFPLLQMPNNEYLTRKQIKFLKKEQRGNSIGTKNICFRRT